MGGGGFLDGIPGNMSNDYLLHIVDVVALLGGHLKDVEDSPVDVQHRLRDISWSEDLSHQAIGVLKLNGGH